MRNESIERAMHTRGSSNHRRVPILLLIAILLIGSTGSAEFLKAPVSITKEKGSFAATANGKIRWTADWTLEPVTVDGAAAVRITENGRGFYAAFNKTVQWTLEAVWRADGRYRPLRAERVFMDTEGKTLATRTKVFDDSRDVALVDGKPITVPVDTITADGLGGVLGSLPLDSGRAFSTHLLTNEPGVYNVSIEPRGRETVRTPAGQFECYKVEFVPQLGLVRVLKPFLPKIYFWFTVAAPHVWVKYQGFENGPGSDQIVVELQSHEQIKQN